MNDLPGGWAGARFGDLCQPSQYGWTTSATTERTNGLRFLRTTDITKGSVNWETVPYCVDEPHDPDRYRLAPGDILISRAGSVGFSAYLEQVEPSIFASYLIRFRPLESMNGRYLAWFLKSPSYWTQIEKASSGITLANVNAKKLSAIDVPIAPAAEQERIVAAVEEQFSRLDAGVAALERAGQNLKRMRARGVSSLFDPQWPRVPLADVLTLISDCPHRTPTYTEREGYPALRPRDVVGGELRLETSARVDAQEYRIQTARHIPEAGDIVYSRELSYGWAVELPEKPLVCLSQGMVILRTAKLIPGFLALFLNSHEGRQQADRAATGTAHPHINIRDIRQYQVPLAAHTDQRTVIARASELLADCDRASQAIAAAKIRASTLRRAVLSYAFSGKLVSQDANDEPAAVLLEKIAVERASSNGHKAVRNRGPRLLREDASK